MTRFLIATMLLVAMCGLTLATDPQRTVLRVQSGYTYQYPSYYYTPYTPPKVTYLLIVPAPEQPAQLKQPEALKQPEPKKQPEKLTQPKPKAEALKQPDPILIVPPKLEQEVIAVLNKHCGTCHGSDKPKGGLTLVSLSARGEAWQLSQLTPNKWWEIYGRANAGSMPPAAATDATKALTEEELLPLLKRASLK